MKKKLVASLAAAMVLGVAGTSFAAANPFTDVPAKHWSYDSVMKLSQAGIVDGYGDGTYKGDKLISRYEMAQMVAKAMAKSDKADAAQKAQIEKLAAEFAEELNVLGVRVSALEKKVGTVKVTGDARVRWVSKHAPGNDTQISERFRVNMSADVNQNTSFYGRLVALQHNEFGTTYTAATTTDGIKVANAEFTTKNVFNTNASATVGRFSQKALATGYFLDTTGMVDGVKFGFGNQVKTTVGYANFSNAFNGTNTAAIATPNDNNIFFATASYATSKVTTLYAAYFDNDVKDVNPMELKGLAVTTKVAPNVGFVAEYAKNTNSLAKETNGDAPNGFVTKFTYKAANVKKQGTFALGAEYRKFSPKAYVHNDYTTATQIPNLGLKGYAISGDYVLAQNILLQGYQTFQTKDYLTGVTKANYSRVQVNYMF